MDETKEPEVKIPEEPKKEKVHYAEIYQKKINELAAQNEELVRKLKDDEDKKLAETNQYKELCEREKKKREMAEEAEKKLKHSYINNFKMDAIKRAALKGGIQEAAVEDIDRFDHNGVEVEYTSSGNINIIGVDEYVNSLKEKKSYLFKKINAPIINNQSPNSNVTSMSIDDLLKLEQTDPAKYREALKARLTKK